MKSRILSFVVAIVIAAGMATVAAQEAYPLEGTWYGDYSTGNQKTDLTVVMK